MPTPTSTRSFRFSVVSGCLTLAVALMFISGCDMFKTDPAEVSGRAVHATTQEPLDGALVEILNPQQTRVLYETMTDAEGEFFFSLGIDSLQTYWIEVNKEGFEPEGQSFTIEPEESYTFRQPFRLSPVGDGDDNGEDGEDGDDEDGDEEPEEPTEPRSITLAARTAQEIGVSGSGSVETAALTFAVLDGNGIPMNEAGSVLVRFVILNQPSPPGASGSEFIYPEEAETDPEGQATVTLTSGTRSGPVQIQAIVETEFGTVTSSPVVTVIHGGLPDQDHFTIAPERRNIAGRAIAGLENEIRVVVGDQYANPVQENTQVYFTTNYGVITGSGSTDAQGRTSATLISGNPLPGDGLVTVTGRTAGVNGGTVEQSTAVLFSGPTVVSLDYQGGDLENGGERYEFVISDDIGNPLEGGSTATVTVTGENLETTGHTNVTVPDALGPGNEITHFNFRIRKSNPDEEALVDNIQISVVSQNGDRTYTWMASRPGGSLTLVSIE